jgi:hypothetical protein
VYPARGHEIRVLEQFTELGGRLHGPKKIKRVLGRDFSEFKEPFKILARHPGAGADRMFD